MKPKNSVQCSEGPPHWTTSQARTIQSTHSTSPRLVLINLHYLSSLRSTAVAPHSVKNYNYQIDRFMHYTAYGVLESADIDDGQKWQKK